MNSTIVLGIAAIALALVFRTQTGSFPEVAQRLPVLLIWLVVALAAMMLVEAYFERRRPAEAPPPITDDEPLPRINWPVLLAFGAAIVCYVVLIPIVGYLITTSVFMAGSLLASRVVTPLKAVLIGVLATASVWFVFIWALNLPVPILPFLK